MRNVIFAIVFLAPPWLKKVILRWFCGAKFGRKANIGWFSSVIGSYVEMGHFSTIKPLTLIRCDGAVAIGSYTEVSSFSLLYGCANLHIGDRCYIGPQSLINVSEDVTIGNGVGMGARTIIFTHGSFLPYTDGYWANFGKVTIGNNVWIATGVFVHPGVTIEDSVFVNSRSVISGTVPFGSVMEGFPAKEVSRLDKIRRPVTPEKRDALIQNMLTHFVSFLKKARPNFEVYDHRARSVLIRSGKKGYVVALLSSNGKFPINLEASRDKRIIILSNCRDRSSDLSHPDLIVFDFVTMSTSYCKDKVHRELYDFMKMYYGVVFSYD